MKTSRRSESPKSQRLLTDIDLVNLVKEGDESAYEDLFKKHYRRVYCICLKMLQNDHEAEDLTQDTFIQVHRKLSSFQGESAFTTWLHRVTVNQVLMHFRKRHVKYEKTTNDGELPESIAAASMDHRKVWKCDKFTLERAIEELPKGYRNVFVLHDIEGYDHEEVAKILGCSIGTSKSQLHKARVKLRKLINAKVNPKLHIPNFSFSTA